MPFGPSPKNKPEDWTEAHRTLWRILKNECRGEANALTQPHLIARLAEAECPTTPREIFYLVRDLALSGFPVGTSGKGVFWCISREELLKARRYLASRFDDLRSRVDALDRLIARWNGGAEPHPAAPARQQALFDEAGQRAT